MKIKQDMQASYDEWRANNTDPLGTSVFAFAGRWAELMEAAIGETPGDDLRAIIFAQADSAAKEADTVGITGYMYGYAFEILRYCWAYGDVLYAWYCAKKGIKTTVSED